ncbi:MAG: SOS response-associated peptidase family protein [Thermodesulfobacteriota bacterium]
MSEKPAFRAAFKRRRCLIPTLGFYEWDHKSETKLWEHWKAEDGEIMESCAIITTDTNEAVDKIHQPIGFTPEDLSRSSFPESLPRHCLPSPGTFSRERQRRINSCRAVF